jgi:hypothetical protein
MLPRVRAGAAGRELYALATNCRLVRFVGAAGLFGLHLADRFSKASRSLAMTDSLSFLVCDRRFRGGALIQYFLV